MLDGCKVAADRDRHGQEHRQAAHRDSDQDQAAAALQGHPDQRRLHAARVRRAGLKAVFRMNEDEAYRVMMTAHRRGACVIAVYAKDVAETKAKEATELGKEKGYPLFFTTEPEE